MTAKQIRPAGIWLIACFVIISILFALPPLLIGLTDNYRLGWEQIGGPVDISFILLLCATEIAALVFLFRLDPACLRLWFLNLTGNAALILS